MVNLYRKGNGKFGNFGKEMRSNVKLLIIQTFLVGDLTVN